MRITCNRQTSDCRRRRALTIMELLVSVAIMTVIIYGLYSMFAHTQKALRGNYNQVDVLDAGRAASGMISQELEELTATGLSNRLNIRAVRTVEPMRQMEADERSWLRTNVLQEVFFMTQFTNQWNGIGYRVMEAVDGVGTLYRYASSTHKNELVTNNLLARFEATSIDPRTRTVSTNLHRVADGIVHFKLTAYDWSGRRLDVSNPGGFTNYVRQVLASNQAPPPDSPATIFIRPDVAGPRPNQTEFFFMSNALPAYLDLELGVLEPETFKQYLSVRGTRVAEDFLRKRANRVHLFRERIPVRTAVP